MTKIKKIEGFEDYSITDSGKVLSEKNGGFKWLRPSKLGIVVLCTNGKVKQMLVHRLVAMAFVPIPSKYTGMSVDELEVHHINFNHFDNIASNLMWLTKAEHQKLHSESDVTKQRRSKPKSDEHKQRISAAKKGIIPKANPPKPVIQYTKDGEFVTSYSSTMEAQRLTKVNQGSISECCNGNRNSAGGFKWKYAA